MQLKDQWKRPRDWKVVAGAGAVAALGITGVALTDPAGGSVPEAIILEERSRVTVPTATIPPPANRVVDLTGDGEDLDSPLPRATGGAGADVSPDTASPDPEPGGDDSGDSPPGPGDPGGDEDSASAAGSRRPGPAARGDDSPDSSPVTGGPDRSPAPGPGDDSVDGSQGS